jgi:hypothetical protein
MGHDDVVNRMREMALLRVAPGWIVLPRRAA